MIDCVTVCGLCRDAACSPDASMTEDLPRDEDEEEEEEAPGEGMRLLTNGSAQDRVGGWCGSPWFSVFVCFFPL